jgi:hypothetical protein
MNDLMNQETSNNIDGENAPQNITDLQGVAESQVEGLEERRYTQLTSGPKSSSMTNALYQCFDQDCMRT